jgi:hypothetical protein
LHLSCTQAVADAELDGNDDMIAITAAHAAKYAVQLVRQSTDLACMTSKVGVDGCLLDVCQKKPSQGCLGLPCMLERACMMF